MAIRLSPSKSNAPKILSVCLFCCSLNRFKLTNIESILFDAVLYPLAIRAVVSSDLVAKYMIPATNAAIPAIIKNGWLGAEWFATWYKTQWIGYVFVSNLIASSVTLIMLLPEFAKIQLKFDAELFKKMYSYSWPVLVANLSFTINESLDKIVMNKLLPPDIADGEVGIYGAVCKIAIFISIFRDSCLWPNEIFGIYLSY